MKKIINFHVQNILKMNLLIKLKEINEISLDNLKNVLKPTESYEKLIKEKQNINDKLKKIGQETYKLIWRLNNIDLTKEINIEKLTNIKNKHTNNYQYNLNDTKENLTKKLNDLKAKEKKITNDETLSEQLTIINNIKNELTKLKITTDIYDNIRIFNNNL